jgi:hypothetical protein
MYYHCHSNSTPIVMQHRLLQHFHSANILQNIHAYSTALYTPVKIFVCEKSGKVYFCTFEGRLSMADLAYWSMVLIQNGM